MNRTVEVVRESYYLEKNRIENKFNIAVEKVNNKLIYNKKSVRIGYLENVKEKQRIIKRIKLLQDSLSFL